MKPVEDLLGRGGVARRRSLRGAVVVSLLGLATLLLGPGQPSAANEETARAAAVRKAREMKKGLTRTQKELVKVVEGLCEGSVHLCGQVPTFQQIAAYAGDTFPAEEASFDLGVACPSGSQVTGGGAEVYTEDGQVPRDVLLVINTPLYQEDVQGWGASWVRLEGSPAEQSYLVFVTANCLAPAALQVDLE